MKNSKLAIVGATGVVGQTILKVLEEKKLPIEDYAFFASKRSCGKKIIFLGKEYMVQELTTHSFDTSFDFAIFSAGSEIAKTFAPYAVRSGCIVIDNSSYFRMNPEVPLIVPEVNSQELKNHHGIIANPNCSTIEAVVALKPLDDQYLLKRVVYTTYQAVSGAGYQGIVDLETGIQNYVNFSSSFEAPISSVALETSWVLQNSSASYKLQKFPLPIFNNCLPHIDTFLENGYTKEEEKMINETKKILKRPNLKITATTVRVPVFNCHSEAINIEFEKDFKLENLRYTLQNSPGIIVKDDCFSNSYPTTMDAMRKRCYLCWKNS